MTAERWIRGRGGVRLRVMDAGAVGDPVVVLVHGFPELSYSWRHQIPYLADAGYRVLVPDMRGYGGSTRPAKVQDYDILALTGDLIALLDAVGAPNAALVGHDWGATVVWQAAQLHPGRVSAVAGLSVPPIPRSRVRPTEAFRRMFGSEYFYMLHYQAPDIADAELAADVRATLAWQFSGDVDPRESCPDAMIRRRGRPHAPPHWISSTEFDHYVTEFSRTGFTGGLNWYRNIDRNWTLTENALTAVGVPALHVVGAEDPFGSFTTGDRAREVVVGPYDVVRIAGAGHWLQQEAPDVVNRALLAFLADTGGSRIRRAARTAATPRGSRRPAPPTTAASP